MHLESGHWELSESLKTLTPGFHSRVSNLINLRCSLGIRIFKAPGNDLRCRKSRTSLVYFKGPSFRVIFKPVLCIYLCGLKSVNLSDLHYIVYEIRGGIQMTSSKTSGLKKSLIDH